MPGAFWPGSGPRRPQRFKRTVAGAVPIHQTTQTGKASIRVATQRTQTAKANLGAVTPKTQPARGRIKGTTSRTQIAVARLRAVTLVLQTALANVLQNTTKTQPAKSRLTAITAKARTSLARLKAVTAQTQLGRGRIGTPNLAVRAPALPGLTVQYGNFRLDESNGIVITTEYDSADTSTLGNFYCEFNVRLLPERRTGDETRDDATFASMMRAVESDSTGLRTPRQKLLVKFGAEILKNWDFNQATQTAFLIQPELTLIRENRRLATYGFRVRCQVPGNIPGNFFRRESMTSTGDSLRERRTCTIMAAWTSSPGKSSLDNYADNGEAFFTAYLPSNGKDQYNNQGTWVRADEQPVTTNDERSLTTATRVYWECFAGRRESQPKSVTTIGDRKVFTAPSLWVQTASANALQNYLDGGDAYYGKILPAPSETNAQWVLVDDEFQYNDRNGVLTVVRIYHETVKGLRDYRVQVTTDAAQLRHVTITGTYYATAQSAYVNFTSGIQDLVRGVLAGLSPPVTRYESKSVPKVEGYDTTGRRYFFTWTINEIAYPQGSGADDADITIQTLDLDGMIPYDAQAIQSGMGLTRLQKITARFTAVVDYQKNQNPAALWLSKFRAHVLTAVATKLGGTPVVDLLEEHIGVGLHANTLQGTLLLLVTGGTTVLSLSIDQMLIQIPARDFAPRADGTDFSSYPYRDVAEKILVRTAICEYVVGTTPNIFPAGALDVSGLTLIDTGKTAQESIDEQNADGPLASTTGWFIDKRAPLPFAVRKIPMTRGAGFKTIIHVQTETWRFLQSIEPGTSIP